MRIIPKDYIPVHQTPRRLAPVINEKVNDIIKVWLSKKIIKESISEYASPIILTKIKNGDRRLNKKIVRDRSSLPLIEDLLDKLQEPKIFSTLDLKDGFFHVPIEEDSTKYMAFVVPDGHIEFLRISFGSWNSPAMFQRSIRAIFRTLIASGTVLAYLDDLIIPTRSEDQNL